MVAKLDQSNALHFTAYGYDAPGMDDIRYVLNMRDKHHIPKDVVVGQFGIMGTDGRDILMNWKVSGYRKDKTHGPAEPVEPMSDYSRDMLKSMFAGW